MFSKTEVGRAKLICVFETKPIQIQGLQSSIKRPEFEIFFSKKFLTTTNIIADNLILQLKNEDKHSRINKVNEKTSLMAYVNKKGALQPAHPHNLISTFVVRCLDSIIQSILFITSVLVPGDL